MATPRAKIVIETAYPGRKVNMHRLKELALNIFIIVVIISSIIFPASACNLPTWTSNIFIPLVLLVCIIFHKHMDNDPGDTILKSLSVIWLVLWSFGLGAIVSGGCNTGDVFNIGYYIAFGFYILHIIFVFNETYDFAPSSPDKRKKWMSKKRKAETGYALYRAAIANLHSARMHYPDIEHASIYAIATTILYGQINLSGKYSDAILYDVSEIAKEHIFSYFSHTSDLAIGKKVILEYDDCFSFVLNMWQNNCYTFEIMLGESIYKKTQLEPEEFQKLYSILSEWKQRVMDELNSPLKGSAK